MHYGWGVFGIIFTLEFGNYEHKCTMVIPCKSYICMLVSTVGIIIGSDVHLLCARFSANCYITNVGIKELCMCQCASNIL